MTAATHRIWALRPWLGFYQRADLAFNMIAVFKNSMVVARKFAMFILMMRHKTGLRGGGQGLADEREIDRRLHTQGDCELRGEPLALQPDRGLPEGSGVFRLNSPRRRPAARRDGGFEAWREGGTTAAGAF